MKMTKSEELMYRTIAELCRQGAPIVFKGGLITKVYLTEGKQEAYIRATKDIDANWIGDTVSMEMLCSVINRALETENASLRAVPFREFDETHSAGIEVIDTDGRPIFRLDIDMYRPVTEIIEASVSGKTIRCVDIKQIIADKICSVSGPTIFRRTKDLIDLYGLSYCASFTTAEIREIAEATQHEIRDFTAFQTRIDELRHAYSKLAGVIEKPEFDTVYERISTLIKPFLHDAESAVWNPVKLKWEDA